MSDRGLPQAHRDFALRHVAGTALELPFVLERMGRLLEDHPEPPGAFTLSLGVHPVDPMALRGTGPPVGVNLPFRPHRMVDYTDHAPVMTLFRAAVKVVTGRLNEAMPQGTLDVRLRVSALARHIEQQPDIDLAQPVRGTIGWRGQVQELRVGPKENRS